MRYSFRNWRILPLLSVAILVSATIAPAAAAQQSGQPGEEIVFTTGLAASLIGQYGRSALHSDLLEYQLVTGSATEPFEGLKIGTSPRGGDIAWQRIEVNEEGQFRSRSLSGGYLYLVHESDKAKSMILEASGFYVVYVNGVPRGGEKYGYDWVQHPVRIREGRNEFLFRGERGAIKAKLVEPEAPVFFSSRDMTLPDLIVGEEGEYLAGVRIINTTDSRADKIQLSYRSGAKVVTLWTVPVPPMTSRKVGIPLVLPAPEKEGKVSVELMARCSVEEQWEELPPLTIELNAYSPGSDHNRTFVSGIDGSVQYYSVSPGHITVEEDPALFLSLHGAAVVAINQARSYAPKSWGHVVAPTNRRPYGFDWEDWGRLDALEVLEDAREHFGTDPQRTYLTGHSMGGHGTWHVGATYPSMFAAIGPSAGWYSFYSYGGGRRPEDPTPVQEMLARAFNPSDTVELARNYLQHGVYILHGERDRSVSVSQARFMRELLGSFHSDFSYYERPGAEHWWGAECVDWPPMFEYFRWHTVPDDREVATVEFVTANPGISAESRWVRIEAQERPLEFSRINITQDVENRTFTGTIGNVARLSLELDQLDPGETVTVELDGQTLEVIPTPAGTDRLWLYSDGGAWFPGDEPDPGLKGPHRYGTFKDAFRHNMVFVYSTAGSRDENEWSYSKARFDAEMFWYRGNGSVDIVADVDFKPADHPDRSVILYGNADTNTIWRRLLVDCPVQVERNTITVGGRTLRGDDLGCYFVYPRPDSDVASVGVVSGTGLVGMNAANAGQYFISGAAFPDLLVFGADMLQDGERGVRVLGFFGNDWSVENGDFVWQDGR